LLINLHNLPETLDHTIRDSVNTTFADVQATVNAADNPCQHHIIVIYWESQATTK
jgi:hypothetical protein